MNVRMVMTIAAACLVFAMLSTPSAQDNWRPHLKALPARRHHARENRRGLARLAGQLERGSTESAVLSTASSTASIRKRPPFTTGTRPRAKRQHRHRSAERPNSIQREGIGAAESKSRGRVHSDQAIASRSRGSLPAGRRAARNPSGDRDPLRSAVCGVRVDRPHVGSIVHAPDSHGRPSLAERTAETLARHLTRTVRGQYARGRDAKPERQDVVRFAWLVSQRPDARHRTVDAGRRDDHVLRGDHHRSNGVHSAVDAGDDVGSREGRRTAMGRRLPRRGTRLLSHARSRHSRGQSWSYRECTTTPPVTSGTFAPVVPDQPAKIKRRAVSRNKLVSVS